MYVDMGSLSKVKPELIFLNSIPKSETVCKMQIKIYEIHYILILFMFYKVSGFFCIVVVMLTCMFKDSLLLCLPSTIYMYNGKFIHVLM